MKNEIKVFFKGDVKDEETTLVKYSHDASLLEVRPKVVVFPKDADDVKNLVKWVGENKQRYPELSITARCAGVRLQKILPHSSILRTEPSAGRILRSRTL